MKLVQHPNVVRLYEVIDTQTKLYLILELGDGGDLYDYIMRHDSGLSEEVYTRSLEPIACNDPALPGKTESLYTRCVRAEVLTQFLSFSFFFFCVCYIFSYLLFCRSVSNFSFGFRI